MPGTRIAIWPDNRPEKVIRKSLWWQWSIVIALVTWIMWFTTNHYNGKSFLVPLSVTLIGVGVGWLFGYKLGFGPVFSSTYIFSAERVINPAEKPWHKTTCPQCKRNNCDAMGYRNAQTIYNCPDCGYHDTVWTGFAKI